MKVIENNLQKCRVSKAVNPFTFHLLIDFEFILNIHIRFILEQPVQWQVIYNLGDQACTITSILFSKLRKSKQEHIEDSYPYFESGNESHFPLHLSSL